MMDSIRAKNARSRSDSFDAVAVVAGAEAVAGSASSGDDEMAVSSGARNDQSCSTWLGDVAAGGAVTGAEACALGAADGEDGVIG